jgi:hypothetical protein
MKKTILLCIAVFIGSTLYSQGSGPVYSLEQLRSFEVGPIQKNTIQIKAHTVLLLAGMTIEYERLFPNHRYKRSALFIRGGGGAFTTIYGGSAMNIDLSVGQIHGKFDSFFEYGLGVSMVIDGNERLFVPLVNIGGRKQLRDEHLLVRYGLCFPYGFYFGIGGAF